LLRPPASCRATPRSMALFDSRRSRQWAAR
jgi:hypothetical protein